MLAPAVVRRLSTARPQRAGADAAGGPAPTARFPSTQARHRRDALAAHCFFEYSPTGFDAPHAPHFFVAAAIRYY